MNSQQHGPAMVGMLDLDQPGETKEISLRNESSTQVDVQTIKKIRKRRQESRQERYLTEEKEKEKKEAGSSRCILKRART